MVINRFKTKSEIMKGRMTGLLFVVLLTVVWMGCEKQSLELQNTPAEMKNEASINNADDQQTASAKRGGQWKGGGNNGSNGNGGNNGNNGSGGGPGPSTTIPGAIGFSAPLGGLNNSGASGTAIIEQFEDLLFVTINASGLEPGSTPLMHIRGAASGGRTKCPDGRSDSNGDGVVDGAEGLQSYGSIRVHLVPAPKVDIFGNLTFQETIQLGVNGNATYEQVSPLNNFHVVLSGMMHNGSFDQLMPTACGDID